MNIETWITIWIDPIVLLKGANPWIAEPLLLDIGKSKVPYKGSTLGTHKHIVKTKIVVSKRWIFLLNP